MTTTIRQGDCKMYITTSDEAREKVRNDARSKVKGLVQKTTEGLPVFPQGYRNPNVPGCTKREKPDWVPSDFVEQGLCDDFMPAAPTVLQLKNLYAQLEEHALNVGATSFECKSEKRKRTPVSSFVDTETKHTYHVIRFWNKKLGKYVDFLRQNATGYIVAFRTFTDIKAIKDAYWCCFKDDTEVQRDFPDTEFKVTNYKAGYTDIHAAVFGNDTVQMILDEICTVHEHHAQQTRKLVERLLHILFALLGEGPRFDLVKLLIYSSIEMFSHEYCLEHLRLGDILEEIVQNWSSLSQTTYFLLLVYYEKKIRSKCLKERHDPVDSSKPHLSHQRLFLQFEAHAKVTQHRCLQVELSEKKLQDVLRLRKDFVNGKRMNYGDVACNQLLGDHLSLLKYLDQYTSSVMMRASGYDKELHPTLSSSSESDKKKEKENENENEKESKWFTKVAEFWKQFADFKKNHQNPTMSTALHFVNDALPFLHCWVFEVVEADLYKEVNLVCSKFKNALERMNETEAVEYACDGWPAKRVARLMKLKPIFDFLNENCPDWNPPQQNQAGQADQQHDEEEDDEEIMPKGKGGKGRMQYANRTVKVKVKPKRKGKDKDKDKDRS